MTNKQNQGKINLSVVGNLYGKIVSFYDVELGELDLKSYSKHRHMYMAVYS
jgi:hypothetical protein